MIADLSPFFAPAAGLWAFAALHVALAELARQRDAARAAGGGLGRAAGAAFALGGPLWILTLSSLVVLHGWRPLVGWLVVAVLARAAHRAALGAGRAFDARLAALAAAAVCLGAVVALAAVFTTVFEAV